MPYYQYFQNFRRMKFRRNMLNVYDKLNAPQVHFITQESVENWFDGDAFNEIHISDYKNVSWRVSARKRERSTKV